MAGGAAAAPLPTAIRKAWASADELKSKVMDTFDILYSPLGFSNQCLIC
jgi:hypothetical protein